MQKRLLGTLDKNLSIDQIGFSVSPRFVFAFRILQGDDEDVQALVVDNGSCMCKAGASACFSSLALSRVPVSVQIAYPAVQSPGGHLSNW